MIIPHDYFMWLCSAASMAFAVTWFIHDAMRLRRFVPKGREARDEIFGSIIGLVIATICVVGVLRFHLSG